VKFRFVQEHRETFRVGMMCRVLKVSRSGFYAWKKRQPSKRELEDRTLSLRIRKIHAESRESYGAPRIHAALRSQGTRVGRKRIARLMRWEGLWGCAKQRFKRTASVRAELPAPPNLLDGDFHSDGPNRVWVGDITHIRTRQGWLYLAVVLDLFSRKVVGYATASHTRQQLALEALDRALASRSPEPGLIHHTDRGGVYLSTEYQGRLDRWEIECSVSKPGRCADNAVAESFFHTLKTEWIYHAHYKTRREARLAIFEYIEGFYNTTRMHSSLDYQSPEEYERGRAAA
jgi:transposase InsO family protein